MFLKSVFAGLFGGCLGTAAPSAKHGQDAEHAEHAGTASVAATLLRRGGPL
ncbi:hypothetical protein ACIBF6_32305 [Streptosporangium amethystogenes]|uniref:hypothetical protein n=1 Tax=Streptosporangium amethystogenes TaxID=2002 RepID=UPI00379EF3E7